MHNVRINSYITREAPAGFFTVSLQVPLLDPHHPVLASSLTFFITLNHHSTFTQNAFDHLRSQSSIENQSYQCGEGRPSEYRIFRLESRKRERNRGIFFRARGPRPTVAIRIQGNTQGSTQVHRSASKPVSGSRNGVGSHPRGRKVVSRDGHFFTVNNG